MIAIKVFPGIAIGAIYPELALCWLVVFLDDVFYDADNTMGTAATSPAQVANSIITAGVASMALTLHRIPSNRTYRGECIARAHVYRICCMAKMVSSRLRSLLMRANTISRRCRKAKASSRHSLTRCFECDDGQTVREGNKTARGTAQRMSHQPDIGLRVEQRHISVYLLSRIIVPVLILQCFRDTGRVALVCRGLTIADLMPCQLSTLSTTAAEEEVVVDLIIRGRVRAIKHGRRCAL